MALEAMYLREKAETLPVGAERDDLLRKARRLELRSLIIGSHLLEIANLNRGVRFWMAPTWRLAAAATVAVGFANHREAPWQGRFACGCGAGALSFRIREKVAINRNTTDFGAFVTSVL
jgi:hypothetical protein